jgi:polar amino acid transport system substrate-binding protein
MKFIFFLNIIVLITCMFFEKYLYSNSSYFENIEVFTTDTIKPMVIINNDKLDGLVGEFLLQSTKNIVKNYKLSVLPFARSFIEVNKKSNSLILPIIRTKDREKQFKWVIKVYDQPFCFINLKTNPKVKTKEDIIKLEKIGALRGSASNDFLERFKINNIEYSNDYNFLSLKLFKGRISAFLGNPLAFKYYWKLNNYDINLLQCSKPFMNNNVSIAASLKSDDHFINMLSKVMENFKRTRKYKLLLKKYGL